MTYGSGAIIRVLLAATAMCGTLPGCSRKTGSAYVPVRGVVLLDGRPLVSGVVQFQPSVGQVATGEIGSDGTFTLSRSSLNDGVAPGTYRVSVAAYKPGTNADSEENLIVPLRYTRFGSSGLEVTVFPGTVDTVTVELSSVESESLGSNPQLAEDGTVSPSPRATDRSEGSVGSPEPTTRSGG